MEDLSASFEHMHAALEGHTLDEAMHTVNVNEEEVGRGTRAHAAAYSPPLTGSHNAVCSTERAGS